jgi:cell division protein FtsI/penicillin-binding protein 2
MRAAKFLLPLTALFAAPFISSADETPARTGPRGRIRDCNGVVLAETTAEGLRRHPYKALAAHIVGFADESKPTKAAGKFGVEATFDDTLRRGADVKLTLDARIQTVVEKTLRDAGVGRGCALVTDPSSGDILASASLPSFDPDHAVGRFDQLLRNPFRPLWNRNITSRAPGAAFHLAVALAAARKDLLGNTYECKPLAFGNRSVTCWLYNRDKSSHGRLSVPEALTLSCGSCMKQLAVDMGIDEISAAAGLLGFGNRTGITLPNEDPGTIGTSAELKTPIETAFLSGGQG